MNHCLALCSGEPALQAADVVQETMLKAYSEFDKLNNRDAFKGWVLRIATRTFISMRRKATVRRTLSLAKFVEVIPDRSLAQQTDVVNAKDVLDRAFQVLSSKEKVALVMYHVSGYSIPEISDFQRDRSVSATKSRLSRSRKKLKAEIRRLDEWVVSSDSLTTASER